MKFAGSGIAAIVGPNGCGKSNLSDAMSWVLGEQSAKSLRGARMEDVIFAGTRDRKPLGLASVTMTLVDPSAEARASIQAERPCAMATVTPTHKPSEVTITRRLFRSGESEYLIDGKVARLRDIQDLFIGTGLGPESYAIIEQGRIGQILSNKPQDRRAIIEEAAGIGKFKTKKRLAEAKLEGAKQNLSRVFDILEEVGRQVNSLKRQASKARRYEELKTEMIAHLRGSLTARFRMLEREAAKTALDLNLANAEFQNLSTQVTEREQEHTALAGGLLSQRCGADRGAAAAWPICNWSRSARAAGWIRRRSRSAPSSSGWRRARRNRRSWKSGTSSCSRSWKRTCSRWWNWKRRSESARERLSAKAAEREQIQQALAAARARRSRPGGRMCCGCWANRRR